MLPNTKHPLPKIALAGLAAAALVGSAAGAASADSVAYIKGGDVYLTTTDAARQFQVTGTGDYVGVSQADDGTLLATTREGTLQRMDRYGQVESEIGTPVSQATNGGSTVFVGPLDADISPDGRTVGYGFMKYGLYQYPDGTRDADLYDGHAFTRSDALTGFTDPGYKWSKDWESPEFLDNNTVLVSNGPGYPSTPFAIETVGSGDPRSWFVDPNNMHPLEATISRNRRFIAAVVGPGRLGLTVYRIGDGRIENATVNTCMTYSDQPNSGYSYNSPTISGDGRLLFWGSGKGLDIAPLGDGSQTCPDPQNASETIPGASQPDWGPAEVPLSRPASVPLRGAQPAPAPAPTPAPATVANGPKAPISGLPMPKPKPGAGTDGASDDGTSLSVRVKPAKLAAMLRNGLTLAITAPNSGTLKVTASKGTKKLGTGQATAKAGKATIVRIRFSASARRSLAHAKRATVTLTIQAPGVPTSRGSVTIKR